MDRYLLLQYLHSHHIHVDYAEGRATRGAVAETRRFISSYSYWFQWMLIPENVIYFYHEDHEGLEDECFMNFVRNQSPYSTNHFVSSLHYLHVLHGNKSISTRFNLLKCAKSRRCTVKNIPCISSGSVIYHKDTKFMFFLRVLRVFVVRKNA
jgi:hypothetical protein